MRDPEFDISSIRAGVDEALSQPSGTESFHIPWAFATGAYQRSVRDRGWLKTALHAYRATLSLAQRDPRFRCDLYVGLSETVISTGTTSEQIRALADEMIRAAPKSFETLEVGVPPHIREWTVLGFCDARVYDAVRRSQRRKCVRRRRLIGAAMTGDMHEAFREYRLQVSLHITHHAESSGYRCLYATYRYSVVQK